VNTGQYSISRKRTGKWRNRGGVREDVRAGDAECTHVSLEDHDGGQASGTFTI